MCYNGTMGIVCMIVDIFMTWKKKQNKMIIIVCNKV